MIFETPFGRVIDLSNLPWGTGHLILCSLRNPRCSSDLVLVLADSIAELRDHLTANPVYAQACARTEAALRDLAPLYAGGTDAAAL